MMWSDHEEDLFQQKRRRSRVLGALFLIFVALAIVAMVLPGGSSYVALAASLAALAATALLGARWHLNGNAADAVGSVARERRAERRHRLARRQEAIREGTWRPPSPPR
jgi:uncharacterized membrane protein YqjE